jgi:dynactin 1
MTTVVRVGQRVRIQSGTHTGAEGYVRFVGRTEFKEGEWIGLELDEPAGKNNGSVGGVAYFRCAEKHGIFLKSGSAIDVLEEPRPAARPSSRPSMQPSKPPVSGRPTAAMRPRTSLAPSTAKRTSIAPSTTSSTSTNSTAKRLSTASQPVVPPSRTSRLSTVGRSSSPKKPVTATTATPIATSSTGRLNLAGPRTTVRSPSTNVTSPSPSLDRVLSPASSKNEPRSSSIQPTTKPASAQSTKISLQQTKLIEELQTKVQFLEKKRFEDREKIRKLPELEEKSTRFETIIEKLQGKCQTLHHENGDLKKQFKENSVRLEELENLQGEHETIEENAILDRQLAEERAESFKTELDALQARMEELELENEILKEENEELGKDMSPEEKASQGWVQLQRENARLRNALLKLRDWSQEQQEDLKEEIKLLEQDTQDLSGIKTKYDETKTRLLTTEAENEDLREQLDAAGNVESMIEQLTERNHDQATQMEELRKTVEHLEFVQQLNEELEVNHVEHEKQLQEVIDVKETQVSEISRRAIKQEDELIDREYTISRFRELVTALQTDLEDMRSSKEISDMETQNLEHSSRAIMDLNRQLQASATSVTVKAIDIELRQLDADQAKDQLSIIQLFVPEAFQTEKDSIMSLLRFKRIGFKARLLHGFIKQRLSGSVVASNEINTQAACDSLNKLVWIGSMCDRFIATIETSAVDQFAKFESTFVELESVERLLNAYIDYLKKDELQEQHVADGLTRYATYFIYNIFIN